MIAKPTLTPAELVQWEIDIQAPMIPDRIHQITSARAAGKTYPAIAEEFGIKQTSVGTYLALHDASACRFCPHGEQQTGPDSQASPRPPAAAPPDVVDAYWMAHPQLTREQAAKAVRRG